MVIGHLTQDVFEEALRRNPNYKAPGPDGIPGVILNNMPPTFLQATHIRKIEFRHNRGNIVLFTEGWPETIASWHS